MNRKNLMLTGLLILMGLGPVMAQKYFTREGKVSFYSDAPMEKIEANNNSATSVIDAESGRMEFAILIKAFQFEKALMQEHFNENYLESDKYPKGTFKGKIDNLDAVDFSKDGTYPVKVSGELTIHGETKTIEADGEISIAGEQLKASSSFEIAVADYKIEIPGVVRDNIAKKVRIDVSCDYQPLKKKS